MSLTIKQLIEKQPSYIINGSREIRIGNVRNTKSKKTGLPAIQAEAKSRSSNSTHTCQIVSISDSSLNGFVKVSCSCDFFKYYCEYALYQWGAANIRYSNGKPARVTNPENYPLVCSHIMALFRKIMV